MTAAELVELWVTRDRRYAMRRELSQNEVDSVMAWRRSELEALPANERAVPWSLLTRWTPPVRTR
jgi:hypothetical protein